MAAKVLSLGVEEEFQIIDASTLELAPDGFNILMRHASDEIRESEQFLPEFLQPTVECITGVCATIEDVRRQTMALRATAMKLAEASGLAIVSAGTHPTSRWDRQMITAGDRYQRLKDLLQEIVYTILIYGLHIHVGIDDEAQRVEVMNQARTYLPYILALSTNSPFWMGRHTGYQSFRTMVWAPFPLSGIPDPFQTVEEYRRFRAVFNEVISLNGTRRMWWDIRSHHTHPTLEFRVADMPMSHREMLAIVAFVQALCQTILWRIERGQPLPTLPTPIISENRWRAARWGLHCNLVEYLPDREMPAREVPARELIGQAIDLVADAADALGTADELAYLRRMLEPTYASGAERQLAAYKRRGNLKDAVRLLIRETREGIDMNSAMSITKQSLFGRLRLRPAG
jgi:carboxylate-amine ligase